MKSNPGKIKSQSFSVEVNKKVTLQCKRWFMSSSSSSSSPLPPPSPTACVVFIHQFGKMGGNGNLLVGMAQQVLINSFQQHFSSSHHQEKQQEEHCWNCVTFDCRGVKKSTGSATWTCCDEVDDAVAVCQHIVQEFKSCQKIFLVGSSAGASVAGSTLDKLPDIKACACIGYTYGNLASILFSSPYKNLINSEKPRLMIHSRGDGFTSMSQFEDLMKSLKGDPKKNKSILIDDENVGHFEMEGPSYDGFMADRITKFFLGC